jgi:hypothetical protein
MRPVRMAEAPLSRIRRATALASGTDAADLYAADGYEKVKGMSSCRRCQPVED